MNSDPPQQDMLRLIRKNLDGIMDLIEKEKDGPTLDKLAKKMLKLHKIETKLSQRFGYPICLRTSF